MISNVNYKLNSLGINYSYTYSDNNRINKVTINNDEINYNFDTLSRLSSYNINNDYEVSYTYKDVNENKTSTVVNTLITDNNTFTYTYDNLGNVINIKRNNISTNNYYYNNLSELIKEDDLVNNITIEYTYDNGGNILSKKYYTYNTTNLIDEINYTYSTNRSDLLTNYDGITITYDSIGNPITIGNNILDWNGRTLESVNNNTYKYNEDGIRISKKVNNVETKYYLEGTNIIFEETNGVVLYYIYDYSGNVIGFNYQNNNYYYEKNIQNDVIGIMDSNYNIIVNYEYDSYGKLLSIKDNNGNTITDTNNIGIINPIRYRSYYYDNETGYYYLNTRYYNPEISRFLNADSLLVSSEDLGGYNLYEYCKNNPINYSDPNGELPWLVAIAAAGIVGAAVGIGSQAVSDTINSVISLELKFSSWETYLGAGVGGFINGGTIMLGPQISSTIGGATTTFTTQQWENVSGKEDRTQKEIIENTKNDALFSLATSYLPLEIDGYTKGRNSYNAIYKSNFTKLRNNTIKRWNNNTIVRGFYGQTIEGMPGTIFDGIKSSVDGICK